MRAFSYTAALTLWALACSSSTAPGERKGPNGELLTTIVSTANVRVGDTMTVQLHVRNPLSHPITVSNLLSQTLIQVVDSGRPAYAPPDGFITGPTGGSLTVAPGENGTLPLTRIRAMHSDSVSVPTVSPGAVYMVFVAPGPILLAACEPTPVNFRIYCARPVTVTVTP